MLTMLSLTSQAKTSFDSIFYKRIDRIGLLSTIALVTAILLLLFLSIPLQESKNLPNSWYSGVYNVFIALTAGIEGQQVGIVLMLLNAMSSLIAVLRPKGRARRPVRGLCSATDISRGRANKR